jgi:hypothetical protein
VLRRRPGRKGWKEKSRRCCYLAGSGDGGAAAAAGGFSLDREEVGASLRAHGAGNNTKREEEGAFRFHLDPTGIGDFPGAHPGGERWTDGEDGGRSPVGPWECGGGRSSSNSRRTAWGCDVENKGIGGSSTEALLIGASES